MKWRRLTSVCLTVALTGPVGASGSQGPAVAPASSAPVLLAGTIVTMNGSRQVIRNGHMLVRDGRISALWQGAKPPRGTDLTGVVRVPLGPHAYIYPGLINLHDHPFYSALPLWQAPSSHRQPELGRPLGTEAYSNRYQWNSAPSQPEEAVRLIANPSALLTQSNGLGELGDVLTFGRARMILGGTTTTQGGNSSAAYDSSLARNVDGTNFGRRRIFSRVGPIGALSSGEAAVLRGAMSAGLVDAWLVHLAEGVRDADRRTGDATSSRAEFAQLKRLNLLTDATVVVHGVGLEPADFAEMAHAPAARAHRGDGRGAKLVWSPLSNLLLYGQTTAVYDALAAGVLVSLGTDWTPSGSANLLTELKVADRTLRDRRLLGARRAIVPGLAVAPDGRDGGAAERALDQLLVEMVTINPARAVRWDLEVGSIEVGKTADLLVIDARPTPHEAAEISQSPYRRLIDATERDVALVMVGGVAQAGDLDVMAVLKPGDFEVVSSEAGCFDKGVDVTAPSVPPGTETLTHISARIVQSLRALGADLQPVGSGPSSPFSSPWSYLQAHIPGASALPVLTFNLSLAYYFGTTRAGQVNLEAMRPAPLFTADDHWWFASLASARDPSTGVTTDPAPPYAPYPSNANQDTSRGSPFAAPLFHDRWYGGRCASR